MIWFHFLPVWKPIGASSFDMVRTLRRCLPKSVKVGHCGTLDPFAEGLLLLALGKATRFTEDVHALAKTYEATLMLGQQTETLDPEGQVTVQAPIPAWDQHRAHTCASRFVGQIDQVPPAFSAKHVGGQRSYALARSGTVVSLPPVPVTIHALEVLSTIPPQEIHFSVTCSTGTYIRSLGRDLAEALGTVGYLTALKRTKIGSISLAQAMRMSRQQELTWEECVPFLLSVSQVCPNLPQQVCPEAWLIPLRHGQSVRVPTPLPPQLIAVFEKNGKPFCGIRCSYDERSGRLQPNFLCYEVS
jgi:tRNA pseudouridine55 synthase